MDKAAAGPPQASKLFVVGTRLLRSSQGEGSVASGRCAAHRSIALAGVRRPLAADERPPPSRATGERNGEIVMLPCRGRMKFATDA
jgi:hypothetical protein